MVRISSTARRAARVLVLAAVGAVVGAPVGIGQTPLGGLAILPVYIELSSGQLTTVLTVQNLSGRETDFQVRPFAWGQAGDRDQLTPTDALLVSPPLGHIAVGAGQVVRLVLRGPAQGHEVAYRILLDQVPPPPEPGKVGFALRLSIPVFEEPSVSVTPQLRWSVQAEGDALYLVAVNNGGRHDTVHGLALADAGGRSLALETGVSPYILAGATRRWRIITTSSAPSREALRLTARDDEGAIDQAVSATSASP